MDILYLSARSDDSIDPSQVPIVVSEFIIMRCCQTATITLLVYDTLLCLDKEAKYFWRRSRNTVDFVYFAKSKNRYVAILGAIADLVVTLYNVNLAECKFSVWTPSLAAWATLLMTDYILLTRVLALYSREKRLSMFLKSFLALDAAFRFGMIVYAINLQQLAVGNLAKDVIICGKDRNRPWQWDLADWLVQAVYQVILTALALYKAVEYWRLSARLRGFALVKVLIEDQILYFTMAIACSMANILGQKMTNEVFSTFLLYLGNPLNLSILGSRMLFNLKEAAERGLSQGSGHQSTSRTVSDLNFADPAGLQRESHSDNEELSGVGEPS